MEKVQKRFEQSITYEEPKEQKQVVETVPECAYCKSTVLETLLHCDTCNRWFCNGKTSGMAHIIFHLCNSGHKSISFHKSIDPKGNFFSCNGCSNKNIFNLGITPLKKKDGCLILCYGCNQLLNERDYTLDKNGWEQIVKDRAIDYRIVRRPTDEEKKQIQRIDMKKLCSIEEEFTKKKREMIKDTLPCIKKEYENLDDYMQIMTKLLDTEAVIDHELETFDIDSVTVKWRTDGDQTFGDFVLLFISDDKRLRVSDKISLKRFSRLKQQKDISAVVVRAVLNHYTIVLDKGDSVDVNEETVYTIHHSWNSIPYDRKKSALRVIRSGKAASFLTGFVTGNAARRERVDLHQDYQLCLPKAFPELNDSQKVAVEEAVKHNFTLIQGPPGTGKTVTSTAIIANIVGLAERAKKNVKVSHSSSNCLSLLAVFDCQNCHNKI